MAITEDQVKIGLLVRHKGGKLYKVNSSYYETPEPRWAADWIDGVRVLDKTKVYCTQWQVNEKHPEGRSYQAARELKLTDLTIED